VTFRYMTCRISRFSILLYLIQANLVCSSLIVAHFKQVLLHFWGCVLSEMLNLIFTVMKPCIYKDKYSIGRRYQLLSNVNGHEWMLQYNFSWFLLLPSDDFKLSVICFALFLFEKILVIRALELCWWKKLKELPLKNTDLTKLLLYQVKWTTMIVFFIFTILRNRCFWGIFIECYNVVCFRLLRVS
jgi:hypothetical protein